MAGSSGTYLTTYRCPPAPYTNPVGGTAPVNEHWLRWFNGLRDQVTSVTEVTAYYMAGGIGVPPTPGGTIIFDGGGPSTTYPVGPVFDCGGVT
jgi:hypothetical protein